MERLRQGTATQRDAAEAIDANDPGVLLRAIEARWAVEELASDVRAFVEQTLGVDRLDGPFDLRGVAAALTEPIDPNDMIGVTPPGLDGAPLPWLLIGACDHGDLYLSLPDAQVGCFPPEVPSELWSETSDYVRASYARFHQEIFFEQGWYNDLPSLLAFQTDCAAAGIEREAALHERLEEVAEICVATFGSGANVERFLSNRWFGFSSAELREARTLAARSRRR